MVNQMPDNPDPQGSLECIGRIHLVVSNLLQHHTCQVS